MNDIKKLAAMLKALEAQLVVCMRCGMCQAVCPVFAETGRESDVARGKLALLDGLMQEMLKDPLAVQQRLSRCLLCGSCAANCPSGVKVLDIFLKARAVIASYIGLSPAKKILFRKLLTQPALFDRLLEWSARFQSALVKPADDLIGTSCARFVSPLGERHFKALAPQPFHRLVPACDTPAGASGLKVAFFVGCVIDKVFPQVGQAVLRVLQHHGVGLFIPAGAGCCGIPALASGDTQSFAKLVRLNLQALEAGGFDFLITACATCTSTIKKIWPILTEDFDPALREQVQRLAAKTLDISQLLVQQGFVAAPAAADPAAPVPNAIPVTYHDPCHLKKSLGVAAQPRAVLQANPRYRFVEMKEPDSCCGCGGSFNLQHYELSSAIGQRKRGNIVAANCDVVATSCPACMLQLSDMLSQAGDRVAVRHAIEIYAETLGAEG